MRCVEGERRPLTLLPQIETAPGRQVPEAANTLDLVHDAIKTSLVR
jgi:hypothetical protein